MSAPRRPARLTTAQADLYTACLGLATGDRTPPDVLAGYATGPYAQPAADLLAVRAALALTGRLPGVDQAAAGCGGCRCCPARACDPGEPLGPGICGPDCPCHPDDWTEDE